MSDPVTIYHNPRCGKSRDTLKLIEDRGIAPRIVEYLKEPPTAAQLARILELLGKRPAEILRKKEAAEAGIDPAKLDDAALIAVMVANPIVIERPSWSKAPEPPSAARRKACWRFCRGSVHASAILGALSAEVRMCIDCEVEPSPPRQGRLASGEGAGRYPRMAPSFA